ncbi:MAG: APC family permease [Solirubrobacteraceae bacterium]
MSTFEEASRDATTGAGDGSFFARQATGLVREGKAYDAFIYNVMWSGGALTLAFMYLLVPTLYPAANLPFTVLIAAILGIGGAFLYALLTTLMPRTGGDYVFVSRTIHPFLGFAANFSYVFWNMVVVGVYATFLSTYGVGAILRMLVGFGASDSLLSTADWFASDWGIFVSGTVMTVLAAATFILGGTQLFFRLQQMTFVIYIIGAFLLVVIVGLLTSHASFLGSFNDYAQNLGTADAAAKVQAGAAKAGYTDTGYTVHDTIKAVSVAWFIFGFIFSSNYFAGEIKTGRRTQFYAIPGAVALVVLLLLITIPSFQHMAGRDFINQLGTADPAAYGFGAGAPAYPEIAAIGSGSPILGFIIIVGFLGGIVAWLPMTMMLASRCMLAWSFDKVMPEKLSDVDERTHSPIVAVLIVAILYILSTAAYAFTDWFTTLTVLFPETLTLLVVAVAGAILPYRRRELYESSARARRAAGLPLLTVVGILAFVGFLIAEIILLTDPGSGTSITDNPRIVLISLGIFFGVGPLIYFGSRAWRRTQGIDLDLAYAEIPPE